jgi:hypothetical protein
MLYGTSLDDRPEKKGPKGKADYVAEQGLHAGQSEGGGGGNAGNPNTGEGQFTANNQTLKGGRLFQNQTTNKEERDHFKRYGQTISQAREVQQQRELEKKAKEQEQVQAIADIAKAQIKKFFDDNPLPKPEKRAFAPIKLELGLNVPIPQVAANNQGFGLVQSPYEMRTTQYGMNVPSSIPPVAAIAENLDNPDSWERIKAGFVNRNLAGATVYGVMIPIIVREHTIQNSGASSGTFSKQTFARNLTFDSIGMLKIVGPEYLISNDVTSGTHTGGL